MSEEGKTFNLFALIYLIFFFLVVICFMFGLEISGYVLPFCPPMQTHQRQIGFPGAPSPCGVSVPCICYFKLFGFLWWVNKFWLSRKKKEKPTVNQANFHLFSVRHLSWKPGKCVYPLASRHLSTFQVPCSKQSLSSNSQCGHCKQRGWTQSESSETIPRTYSVCFFYGKKGARSASFTGGV